ncbi:MAG: hypothetical protein KDC72_03610, partial [Bacteroidetes bacterium]|nr:hypothetical protein [Bacteroidota bacterium]
TFAQMPNRITNVEFITVSPTIANTMLAVRCLLSRCFCSTNFNTCVLSIAKLYSYFNFISPYSSIEPCYIAE